MLLSSWWGKKVSWKIIDWTFFSIGVKKVWFVFKRLKKQKKVVWLSVPMSSLCLSSQFLPCYARLSLFFIDRQVSIAKQSCRYPHFLSSIHDKFSDFNWISVSIQYLFVYWYRSLLVILFGQKIFQIFLKQVLWNKESLFMFDLIRQHLLYIEELAPHCWCI